MTAPHCGWCHPDACTCRPARPEMPADVRRFALAYTSAADLGHMVEALAIKERWPAGLAECSCEGGVVRNGEDDCSKCGGVGLYYQPESEAA